MSNYTYIYILIDPLSNMIRYVGKTNNPDERYRNHKNSARDKNTHKRNWINGLRKKGLAPEMEIIEKVLLSEWKYWEKFWIGYCRYIGCDLVNYTAGGDGLTFGNQTSFKKGNGGKPVVKVSLDGKLVQRFSSAYETGIKIDAALDKISRTAHGYMWFREENWNRITPEELKKYVEAATVRYVRSSEKVTEVQFKKGHTPKNKGKSGYFLKGKKHAKQVIQFDLLGNEIAVFRSCFEAAIANNCKRDAIENNCRGVSKITRGFIFKYKTEAA